MNNEPQNFAMIASPTRMERFWKALGFRFHLGETEDATVPWSGWLCAETTMHLGWADRLRILASGRLKMRHVVDMDTPSPSKTFTRFDWQILYPWSKP